MEKKTNLSTILLILALIVIVIMGYFIYKISNEKNIYLQRISELENREVKQENSPNKNTLTSKAFKNYIENKGLKTFDALDTIPDSMLKDGLKSGYLSENNNENNFRINFFEFIDETYTMYGYYDEIAVIRKNNIGELLEKNETKSNYLKYTAISNNNYIVMIKINNTIIWGTINKDNQDTLNNILKELGY